MQKTLLALLCLISFRLFAVPYTGTVDLTGSTVDVEVVDSDFGLLISANDVAADSGSVNVSVNSALTELILTGGSFTVEDTSMTVPLTSGTVSTTGLGFTVNNSVFTLAHDSGNTYAITGTLFLWADQGGADSDIPFYEKDFESEPVFFEPELLPTSTVTLTPSTPDTYTFSAALKFASTVLDTVSSGISDTTINVSSDNTILLTGTVTAIPEPGTLGLLAAGLLITRLALRRRS